MSRRAIDWMKTSFDKHHALGAVSPSTCTNAPYLPIYCIIRRKFFRYMYTFALEIFANSLPIRNFPSNENYPIYGGSGYIQYVYMVMLFNETVCINTNMCNLRCHRNACSGRIINSVLGLLSLISYMYHKLIGSFQCLI